MAWRQLSVLILLALPGTGFAASLGLDQLLINLSGVINPYTKLVTAFAYLAGLAFMFRALYYLKVYGEARTMMSVQSSIKTPLIYMLVAAMFVYFPTGLQIMLQTTFGDSNILGYSEWQGHTRFGNLTVQAVFRIVQFVGVVAFIRGWFIVANSADKGGQPGQFGKAITHIIGGILAMNIIATTNIVSNTLGITFFGS